MKAHQNIKNLFSSLEINKSIIAGLFLLAAVFPFIWLLADNSYPSVDTILCWQDAYSYAKNQDIEKDNLPLQKYYFSKPMFPCIAAGFVYHNISHNYKAIQKAYIILTFMIFFFYIYYFCGEVTKSQSPLMILLIIASFPWVSYQSVIFEGEFTFLAASFAFLVHLNRSIKYEKISDCFLSGLFLFIAVASRPAEAILFTMSSALVLTFISARLVPVLKTLLQVALPFLILAGSWFYSFSHPIINWILRNSSSPTIQSYLGGQIPEFWPYLKYLFMHVWTPAGTWLVLLSIIFRFIKKDVSYIPVILLSVLLPVLFILLKGYPSIHYFYFPILLIVLLSPVPKMNLKKDFILLLLIIINLIGSFNLLFDKKLISKYFFIFPNSTIAKKPPKARSDIAYFSKQVNYAMDFPETRIRTYIAGRNNGDLDKFLGWSLIAENDNFEIIHLQSLPLSSVHIQALLRNDCELFIISTVTMASLPESLKAELENHYKIFRQISIIHPLDGELRDYLLYKRSVK